MGDLPDIFEAQVWCCATETKAEMKSKIRVVSILQSRRVVVLLFECVDSSERTKCKTASSSRENVWSLWLLESWLRHWLNTKILPSRLSRPKGKTKRKNNIKTCSGGFFSSFNSSFSFYSSFYSRRRAGRDTHTRSFRSQVLHGPTANTLHRNRRRLGENVLRAISRPLFSFFKFLTFLLVVALSFYCLCSSILDWWKKERDTRRLVRTPREREREGGFSILPFLDWSSSLTKSFFRLLFFLWTDYSIELSTRSGQNTSHFVEKKKGSNVHRRYPHDVTRRPKKAKSNEEKTASDAKCETTAPYFSNRFKAVCDFHFHRMGKKKILNWP